MNRILLVGVAVMSLCTLSLRADESTTKTMDAKLASEKIGTYLVEGRADVLLITSAELKDSWASFAHWKTKTGRPTKIVTVEDIDSMYDGQDVQEKIRQCCLSHIEHQQTRWVVLGGDSRGRKGGHVPDRDTHHAGFYKYKNIPTDIYYLSRGDWDANDDGVFGQFEEDLEAIDYTHSDASLGRIPVRTAADVEAYTAKVIEYESQYPEGAFAKKMIYTSAVEHANPKLNTSRDDVGAVWETGEIGQFFIGDTPWDKDEAGDHNLSAENWIEMINNRQAGKIHMHGHGLINLWVLENDSLANADAVEQLENKAAYPVMTTVSCFTGQFDAFRDPSITESMLRKKGGGAIAIIAPSREGIPVFHERSDFRLMMTEGKMDGTTETLTRFWMHALEKNMNLGDAFRAAKNDMTTHARKTDGYHFVQCELNLLGDPTLDVRAKSVETLKGSVATKPQSDGLVEVTVSGLPDATISLWHGAKCFETKIADSNGTAVFQLTPDSNHSCFVSARAANHNLWWSSVDVK